MTDRNDQDVRDAVRYELDARFNLSKNGESWKRYVLRQITIERIGLIALLIFNYGGSLAEAKRSISDASAQALIASQKADAASTKAAAASQRAEEAAQAMVQTRQDLAGVVYTLDKQAQQNADLRDRVALSVTRSEFATALAQQVVPRLERIERQVWDNRK